MDEICNFLATFEHGATEDELSSRFPKLRKPELAIMLNGLVESHLVDVIEEDGKLIYAAVRNKIVDYESMVISLLSQAGTNGLWLRDIKARTNIPHNLILKILRSLESTQQIKSLKSIKTNRKMYMLYGVQPDEDMTGGVWFNSNDVDLVFVEKLMEIICKYCKRREERHVLPKLDSLVRVTELKEFIDGSRITEVELSMADINTLIDTLVYDNRIEKYQLEDGTALRVLEKYKV